MPEEITENTETTTQDNLDQSNVIGDSILRTIRKLVSSGADTTDFDADLLIHINSVLAILQQLGVGPENGYFITDESATWTDYLGNDSQHINMVKSYMGAKVRMLFDAPVSSAVADSLNRIISEFEWRANVAAENHNLHKEATDNESDSDIP